MKPPSASSLSRSRQAGFTGKDTFPSARNDKYRHNERCVALMFGILTVLMGVSYAQLIVPKEAPTPQPPPRSSASSEAPAASVSREKQGTIASKPAIGEALVPPATDAAQRPPGLTKAEYAKDLPELIAALKAEPDASGKIAVVVRPEGLDVTADLLRLQFKDGDVITNINRGVIESLEQAQRILETLNNDPGFNVRFLRNGQPSRMRVNVVDAAMPPKQPPDLTKMGKNISFGRQQIGTKVKMMDSKDPKGSFVQVGDTVNGLTIKEITKTSVVLMLPWEDHELTIEIPRK